MSFEGHQGKEPSDSMFHPKAKVQKAGSQPAAIQGFSVTMAKSGKTKGAFLKSIGD